MKHTVVFLRSHTVEHPATVLESTLLTTGEKTHIADIPASVSLYLPDQRVVFSRKADAIAFVKSMNAGMHSEVAYIEGLPRKKDAP